MVEQMPDIASDDSARRDPASANPGRVSLLLASASPARLATLRSAGVEPAVQVSGVDEPATLARAREERGHLDPADVALTLARAKAERVADDLATEDADLVLGCDSVLEFEGEVYGKPQDAAEAIERWRAMRGNSGTLHSGHWLIDRPPAADGNVSDQTGRGATASTIVHFADLTDEEIEAYVATGEPLHVAGAFTVDGMGGPYVTGIEGDYHAVVGVSLPLLRHLVAELGIAWHHLWRG